MTVTSALLGVGTPARGDQIVVRGENFKNARIVTLANGLLQFRGDDGAARSAHLADIDLLITDRSGLLDDFNEAERLLDAGEPKKAAIRYRRALRMSQDFWGDLIAARLVIAHDRAMEIDKAVQHFIRVTSGKWAGPVAAARLIPRNLPPKRTGALARAVRELDGALAAHPQESRATVLEITRYSLLRRMNDSLAPAAAASVVARTLPTEIRTQRVYDILVSAMRSVVGGDGSPKMFENLDRAIADCPAKYLPDFLLMKGDALLRSAASRDDLMRASWPFLRVAIHMENDPRAARGLVGAARVFERLSDKTSARKLLTECVASANAEASVADVARRMLDELNDQEKSDN